MFAVADVDCNGLFVLVPVGKEDSCVDDAIDAAGVINAVAEDADVAEVV